jgi:hypothetical protein
MLPQKILAITRAVLHRRNQGCKSKDLGETHFSGKTKKKLLIKRIGDHEMCKSVLLLLLLLIRSSKKSLLKATSYSTREARLSFVMHWWRMEIITIS